MNPVAQATLYPLACPGCQTITSRPAAEILEAKQICCRACSKDIPLNEAQLNKLRRTIADLTECLQRSAEHYQPPPQISETNK